MMSNLDSIKKRDYNHAVGLKGKEKERYNRQSTTHFVTVPPIAPINILIQLSL